MQGRTRQTETSFGGRMAVALIAVLAVTLLLVATLYSWTGRGAAGVELAQLSYARTARLAAEVERTLTAQGQLGSGTKAFLSRAAADLDASLTLFYEADTPLAVAHGPSLNHALGRIRAAEADGRFSDSGQQPWIPQFGDPLDGKRFPRLHGRPVRVQTEYPWAVEAPVGRNMTLRQVPLALQPFGDGGFRSSLFVVFILMSLVAVFVVLRLTRPLEATAMAFERMASGSLTAAMPATGIRELSWIARAARRVAERVRDADEQQVDLLRRVGSLLVEPTLSARKGLQAIDRAAIPPGARNALEAVDSDIEDLHRTVTALWRWRQLEQGQAAATPADVDVRPMLNEVVDLYVARRAPDLVVEIDIDDAVEEAIAMDARLVAGVLAALLDNVRVHGAGPVALAVTRSHTKLEIAVRDAGPGVPFEQLSAIFEPFGRAVPEGDAPVTDGLGLGLRVARLALALHGGGITARNLRGEGFEVSFWLPAPPIRVSAVDKSLLHSVDWINQADPLALGGLQKSPEETMTGPIPTAPPVVDAADPDPAHPDPATEEDLYEPF